MHLQTKLIGHNGPVNCIVFNPSNVENGNQGEWITGSDDCTIRIWVSSIYVTKYSCYLFN